MKFEVRNKVYCSYHESTGTIKDIRPIGTYPILVTFEDGTRIYQSKEGHVVQLSTNSTLS